MIVFWKISIADFFSHHHKIPTNTLKTTSLRNSQLIFQNPTHSHRLHLKILPAFCSLSQCFATVSAFTFFPLELLSTSMASSYCATFEALALRRMSQKCHCTIFVYPWGQVSTLGRLMSPGCHWCNVHTNLFCFSEKSCIKKYGVTSAWHPIGRLKGKRIRTEN